MEIDGRVVRRYELVDEDARLWRPGRGDLMRLRSWDIFERFLPSSGRVLDVGGGPGAHAAHLAVQGYDVTLIDPVPRHVHLATARANDPASPPFQVQLGTAADLPADDGSVDAVLLMGPLYHLVTRDDRLAALNEAKRVLRPGGRVLAEVISRHAWVLDAAAQGLLDSPAIWQDFEHNLETGLSQKPASMAEGSFWAYFHHPDELREELTDANFDEVTLLAVEGFAWLLGDLESKMTNPEPLLRAVRLTEAEPSMLGCSAHLIGTATRQ